jgi:PPK2 family polyphosphate:nucleotide phosphotransferase
MRLMRFDTETLRVFPEKAANLSKQDTRIAPVYESEDHYAAILKEQVKHMSDLQDVLFADGRHALLVIIQGMDASGKDGAIKHVMGGLNPQACRVTSFKTPTSHEVEHDFLWRTVRALPPRGMIGLFNRSYYEEVLIVRVHPEILQGERLPGWPQKPDDKALKALFDNRYESIREHEKHLIRNGTHVVKLFLHISKAEQKRRFLERIDNPAKNWKFAEGDIYERGFFDAYMQAYETCFEKTTTSHAPWYVIPADDKRNARLLMSEVILEALKALNLSYPELPPQQKKALDASRAQLMHE